MKKNLLAKLTDNLALKIISVIIAVVIWYVVVDYNDPIVQRSISGVEVQVRNASYVANGKRVYHIDDQYKSISVIVEGNRSVVNGLTASDITVTADLTQIVDMESTPYVYVPLAVSCPGISREDITLPRETIPITIEDIASQEFAISVDTGGTRPDKNYEIGSMRSSMDTVVISGPKSIISTIESVVAEINVNGMTESGAVTAELKIYDTADNELSETTLEDDLSFDGSGVPDIEVQVELWKKRSGIRFRVETQGEPADGYQISGITTTPEEITVAGTDRALEQLKQEGNVITIPGELISVKGISRDQEFTEIQISDLLPEDLMLASNASETVTVRVAVLPLGSQEFDLDVDQITTNGLDPDLTVSYSSAELAVRVQGTEQDLEELKASEIGASIDLTGKTEGDYTLPVNISLPDGYELVETATINVQLREK